MSLKMALITLLVLATASFAHADEDDDFMEVTHHSSLDTSHRRSYPGARDEQSLEIQAALPQPTRSADGSAAVLEEDGADLPVTQPASD
jgi:hypothetical protein